jgi:hypothetical protein
LVASISVEVDAMTFTQFNLEEALVIPKLCMLSVRTKAIVVFGEGVLAA